MNFMKRLKLCEEKLIDIEHKADTIVQLAQLLTARQHVPTIHCEKDENDEEPHDTVISVPRRRLSEQPKRMVHDRVRFQ